MLGRSFIILFLLWCLPVCLSAQWSKSAATYLTGDSDGYGNRENLFSAVKITGIAVVCAGSDATFSVSLKGAGAYCYKWVKTSDPSLNFGDSATLCLPDCTLDDEAEYYCEVTDLRTGDKQYSDTVELDVRIVPVVKMWASLTRIAEGANVTLAASGALNYSWSTGDTKDTIVVSPGISTRYSVKGYDDEFCFSSASVAIDVLKFDLNIGSNVYISPGDAVVLKAESTQEIVHWYKIVDGRREFIRDALELTVAPLETTCYEAEIEYAGYRKTAGKSVFVKPEPTFFSGANDGYSPSVLTFSVSNVLGDTLICRGSDAGFSVTVTGEGAYTYNWVKMSDPSLNFGDSASLHLPACDTPDESRYYCEVTDLQSGIKKYSDTIRLKIVEVPVVNLWASQTSIAEGASVMLIASGTSYFNWSTGDTKDTIVVSPVASTKYSVKGFDNEICHDDTSVVVEVLAFDLEVGHDLYISPGDTAVLKAVSTQNTVKWYRILADQRVFIKDTKELFAYPSQTTLYEAEVEYQGYKKTARVTVFVKQDFSYRSDINDGYSQAELTFSVSNILGDTLICRGSDAVFSVTLTGEGAYGCKWIKMNDPAQIYPDTVVLHLPACDMPDESRYYCEVTNLRNGDKKYSDTVCLRVADIPAVGVWASQTKVAEGAKVTLIASGASHYSWSTGDTKDTVEVSPMVTTTYTVRGYDSEKCPFDTSVIIEVMSMDLEIGPGCYIALGDSAMIWARSSIDTICWYRIDGNNRVLIGQAGELVVHPFRTTVYEAEVEYQGYKKTARVTVFVKQDLSYRGGLNDGYSQLERSFTVSNIFGDLRVCAGSDANFTVVTHGTGIYSYRWVKLSDTAQLYEDSCTLVLPFCSDTTQSRYFCKVTDIRSGYAIHSDTVLLEVFSIPEVALSVTRNKIVQGEEATLIASGALNYRWSTGEDSDTITVMPSVTTVYTVKVYDYELCYADTSAVIEVVDIDLDAGPDRYITLGDTAALFAVTAVDSVRWYRVDGGSRVLLAHGRPLSVWPAHSTIYEAEAEFQGYKITDRLTVYVKTVQAYQGDRNDGFCESDVSFTVDSIRGIKELCQGEDVFLSVEVSGSSLYSYKWVKMNDRSRLFKDSAVLAIPNCRLSDTSRYYCEVKDIKSGAIRFSDTINLSVLAHPDIRFSLQSQDTLICYGDSLWLDAGLTEQSNALDLLYSYWWTGEALLGRADSSRVVAAPLETTRYILTVSSGRCISKDTVHVAVYKPDVEIPHEIIIMEHETVTLYAETDTNARLDWYLGDRLMQTAKPDVPFVYGPVAGSATVYVHMGQMLCRASDSCRITMKTARPYAGDIQDGFSQSLMHPVIVDVRDLVNQVCDADSVTLKVIAEGTDLKYTWQKDSGGIFVNIAVGTDTNIQINRELLSFRPVHWYDTGRYRCLVSNVCGTVISDTFLIMIDRVEKLKIVPDEVFLAEGVDTTIRITLLNGVAPWKYRYALPDGEEREIINASGLVNLLTVSDTGFYRSVYLEDASRCHRYDSLPGFRVRRFNTSGYIRLRVLLEGAYRQEAGKMVVGTDYCLPSYFVNDTGIAGKRIIDWVALELRAGSDADSVARMNGDTYVLMRDTCMILEDGTVVDRMGHEAIELEDIYNNNDSVRFCYIVLSHRNHLGVMTKSAYRIAACADSTTLVDFTRASTIYCSSIPQLAYHMTKVGTGIWALSAGDVNGNGLISLYDPNQVMHRAASVPGYYLYDVNFDGYVGQSRREAMDDWQMIWQNRNKYTDIRFSKRPD